MKIKLQILLLFAELATQSPLSTAKEFPKRNPQKVPLPSHVPDSSPKPLKNDALWQEAIRFDAILGHGPNPNQAAYQLVQSLQLWENCSHSCDEACPWGPIKSAATISQGLQAARIYPTRFNQAQSADSTQSIVRISPAPQQTIQAFGASGAWWPNNLKDFPPAQQRNLSELLFSKQWLHLSGYRYNMGASGDKDSVSVNTLGRGVESFMKTDGTYDWTRDVGGRYYMAAAKDAGVSVTFFANAMPSALSPSLKPCGCTLSSAQIGDYVSYIESILTHWFTKGITIDYVSAMNEPDNSFSECNQEGMAVEPATRAEVFKQLRAALSASAVAGVNAVKILGDESSQVVSNALINTGTWLPAALTDKSIDTIAIHMYDWPDDAALANYAQLIKNYSASNPPPPIKMTEISTFISASGVHKWWGWTGPGTMGAEFDPTMNSALDMARYIWQWLTLVNAESWDWWVAVSNKLPCSPATQASCGSAYNSSHGYNDGLLYIDPDYATTKNYNFYFTKRFWVFRHFTTFMRPGAVRYDIPNEVLPYGTVAVASKGMDEVWNAIFINRNETSQDITMKLPAAGARVIGLTQTTDAEDWGTGPLPSVAADNSARFSLPGRAVLSLQLK